MLAFINGSNVTSNVQTFMQFRVERSSDQSKTDRTQVTTSKKTGYLNIASNNLNLIKLSDKAQQKDVKDERCC